MISKINNFPQIEFLQPMYNIVKRQVEVEILPMAISEKLNVVSYSPLGGGFLTGKYNLEAKNNNNIVGRLDYDEKYKKRYGQEWMRKVSEDFIKLSKRVINSDSIVSIFFVVNSWRFLKSFFTLSK